VSVENLAGAFPQKLEKVSLLLEKVSLLLEKSSFVLEKVRFLLEKVSFGWILLEKCSPPWKSTGIL